MCYCKSEFRFSNDSIDRSDCECDCNILAANKTTHKTTRLLGTKQTKQLLKNPSPKKTPTKI